MDDSSSTTLLDHDDTLINIPLPRGEACLPCRRRKSKCDGTKPICRQCSRGKRANDCRYDPSKAWSRNRKLQHRLIQVEQRIRQMETKIQSPSQVVVPLPSEPQSQFPFESHEFSMITSFDILGTGASVSTPVVNSIDQETPACTTNSSPEDQAWFEPQGSRSTSGGSSPAFDSPSDGETHGHGGTALAPEFQEVLLHSFVSHSHQLAFFVDTKHIRESLAAQPSGIDQAHPSLRNAIFALGCYFSRLGWLNAQEAQFFDQALYSLHSDLSKGEKMVDIAQACCLLACYSFVKGKILDTNYFVASASRIAVGLNLHQLLASEYSSPWALNNTIPGPSRNLAEVIEAATIFWNIYVVDRLYSVVLGVPSTLVDDGRPRTRIRTPLPDRISAFQLSDNTWVDPSSPLSTFFSLSQTQCSGDFSHLAVASLYAKVAELFERSSRLAYASSGDEGFIALEKSLSDVLETLPPTMPPRGGENFPEESISYSLMTLRSLIHAATVQLHRQLSLKELSSHAKSLVAAEHIITIVREYWDADYAYFDPILGSVWMFAVEVLLRERMLGQHADVVNDDTMSEQLSTMVTAMKRLGALFPVAAIQLAKVEQSINSSTHRV